MAREDAPVTKKKRQHLLALVAQIPSSRFPCADQIANGLMDLVWHPDRHQFARSQQARQGDRVAPVGLHAIARARRHKRGRDHIADMAEGSDVAVKPIPGWAGLIADVQGLVLARQLTQEPLNGSRRGLDLAEIAHLPLSAALRNGHGVLGLRCIESDVSYAMMVHGPSSLA